MTEDATDEWKVNPRDKVGTPGAAWGSLEEQALRMRRESTLAETILWRELRSNKLDGLKFRRQHAVGHFIVDFYCVRAALVVEVDGPIHESRQDADEERNRHLEGLGLTVVRVTNAEVFADVKAVLTKIRLAAAQNL